MVMVSTERPALEEAVVGATPMTFWGTDIMYRLIEEAGTSPLYLVGASGPGGPYAVNNIRIAGFQLVVPDWFVEPKPPVEIPCYLALLRPSMTEERTNNPQSVAEGLIFVCRIGRTVFLKKSGKTVHYVPLA